MIVRHSHLGVGKFLQWNDFVAWRLDNLVPHLRVNIFGKVAQERLIFVLVEFLRKKKDLVILQQLVEHVHQDVRLA